MKKHIKTLSLLPAITLVSACITPQPHMWQANHYVDEFTETPSCRVQFGTAKQRSFNRSLFGQYMTYNFYAENYNGEVRAGVRSEPQIPISGDVQIKVGKKLYTLSAQDVPLDATPTGFSYNPAPGTSKALDANMKNFEANLQKMASPYRAFTGKKAKALLRNIVGTKGQIKFRTIGVNTATSATGAFTVDENFAIALKECGIKL